jgi:hypothetical protein
MEAHDDQEVVRVAPVLDDRADVGDSLKVPQSPHQQLGGDEHGDDQ